MDDSKRNLSRRGFLMGVGAGTAAVAACRVPTEAAPPGREVEGTETAKIQLTINGRAHRVLVEPRWSLLFVLRERLGLTATKVGCERGECGACTVLIDGRARYACLTLAVEAAGREITTVEGLLRGEELGPVQQAFLDKDGFQCGYCTSGQMMSAEGLLRHNPDPTVDEIRVALSGNLCRCGAYPNIVAATRDAAARKRGES